MVAVIQLTDRLRDTVIHNVRDREWLTERFGRYLSPGDCAAPMLCSRTLYLCVEPVGHEGVTLHRTDEASWE